MITKQDIRNGKILIVDDQEINIRLLTDIFEKEGYSRITGLTDSRQVLEKYEEINPDLMILDLMMPHVDGFEILRQLTETYQNTYLPVLILSNIEDHEARYKALEMGAKDFVNKPYDRIEVLRRIHNIIETRLLHLEQYDQNVILEKKVHKRTKELYETQVDVIQRLARAIEYRDLETGGHIIRMSKYSSLLSKALGFSVEDAQMVETAAPLHDIGKIGIPDSILLKPGKLSPEEFEIMKTHTTIGGELLDGNKSKLLETAKEIALSHHERWDGSGYPKGLNGNEIPFVGRICCICDVFDALTTKRPYKEAWDIDAALMEIEKCKGIAFDPEVVDEFINIFPQINEVLVTYLDS